MAQVFSFNTVQFIYFFFLDSAFGAIFKAFLLISGSQKLSHMSSAISSVGLVLHLSLVWVIYFFKWQEVWTKAIFWLVHTKGSYQSYFFGIWIFNCSSTTFWNDYFFLQVTLYFHLKSVYIFVWHMLILYCLYCHKCIISLEIIL